VEEYSQTIGVTLPAKALDSKTSVAGYQSLMDSLRAKKVQQDRLPRIIISVIIVAVLGALAVIFWKKGMLWRVLGAIIL